MDYDGAENGAGSANQQGKKLVISDEYFQRVTQALVMRLRQHEEAVTREGNHRHLCNCSRNTSQDVKLISLEGLLDFGFFLKQ